MQSVNRVTLLGVVSKLPESRYIATKAEASVF